MGYAKLLVGEQWEDLADHRAVSDAGERVASERSHFGVRIVQASRDVGHGERSRDGRQKDFPSLASAFANYLHQMLVRFFADPPQGFGRAPSDHRGSVQSSPEDRRGFDAADNSEHVAERDCLGGVRVRKHSDQAQERFAADACPNDIVDLRAAASRALFRRVRADRRARRTPTV